MTFISLCFSLFDKDTLPIHQNVKTVFSALTIFFRSATDTPWHVARRKGYLMTRILACLFAALIATSAVAQTQKLSSSDETKLKAWVGK